MAKRLAKFYCPGMVLLLPIISVHRKIESVNKFLATCLIAAVVTFTGRAADTNLLTTQKTITKTNILVAADNFRIVSGQLYNSEASTLWQQINARVIAVNSNSLLLQTFTLKPIYEQRWVREFHNSGNMMGGYPVNVQKSVKVGDEKVNGKKVVLVNYPKYKKPADGQELGFSAMRVGTTNLSGSTLELWDYGLPNVVTQIVTTPKR